jgi:hypothetical protein
VILSRRNWDALCKSLLIVWVPQTRVFKFHIEWKISVLICGTVKKPWARQRRKNNEKSRITN